MVVIRYGIREISPIDCLDPPHFLRNDSAEATLKLDVKQAVNTPSERLTKVKRLLKLVISAGFYLLILLRDSVCKMLGGRPHGTCVVLGYHAIPAEVRSRFAWQMDELLNYSTAIAANSRMRLHAGERFTAVTFDDGFLSVVENAVPSWSQGESRQLFLLSQIIWAPRRTGGPLIVTMWQTKRPSP